MEILRILFVGFVYLITTIVTFKTLEYLHRKYYDIRFYFKSKRLNNMSKKILSEKYKREY